MRRRLRFALPVLCALAAGPVLAKPIAISVQDKGRPTLCAEEDNVYAAFSGPSVRRFFVAARAPAYAGKLKTDVSAADFANCAISASRDYKFTPRTVTLYEDRRVIVKGVTYPSYWRPEKVPVEIAGKQDKGFHLLQLFLKRGGAPQEVMVLHAADGYWRARPLPLPQFKGAVYGSSFLLGPIQEKKRPFVRIAKVTIDPVKLIYHVDFVQGGGASVQLVDADQQELGLAVSLNADAAKGPMFAAVRSMYVTPDKADTARFNWRDRAGWKSVPAVGFGAVQAHAVRFDRVIPSKHNTSAPDLVFEGFDDQP